VFDYSKLNDLYLPALIRKKLNSHAVEKVPEYHLRWFKHVWKRFVEAAVRIVV